MSHNALNTAFPWLKYIIQVHIIYFDGSGGRFPPHKFFPFLSAPIFLMFYYFIIQSHTIIIPYIPFILLLLCSIVFGDCFPFSRVLFRYYFPVIIILLCVMVGLYNGFLFALIFQKKYDFLSFFSFFTWRFKCMVLYYICWMVSDNIQLVKTSSLKTA